MNVWDTIIEIKREMRARRPGFYAATVSAAGDALRRMQIVPEWMQDGAIDRALSIQSPILDVRPPVGATVAVIGRDGLPERPAILGVLWDRLPTLTVWLRADLARHAGHVELGATRSVRVRVGPDLMEIAPLPDGTISIESTARIALTAPDVRLGSDGATGAVALASGTDGALTDIATELNKLITYVNGLAPGTAIPIVMPLASVAATKVTAE